MTVLFAASICIRLIGYDAWEKPTLRILMHGEHSALVELADINWPRNYPDSVRFEEMKHYKKVDCPNPVRDQ